MGKLALVMAWTKAPSVLSWAMPPLPGLVYSTVISIYLGAETVACEASCGAAGKPGKSECSKAARLCCMESPGVKKFLESSIEAGAQREFFRKLYASR